MADGRQKNRGTSSETGAKKTGLPGQAARVRVRRPRAAGERSEKALNIKKSRRINELLDVFENTPTNHRIRESA